MVGLVGKERRSRGALLVAPAALAAAALLVGCWPVAFAPVPRRAALSALWLPLAAAQAAPVGAFDNAVPEVAAEGPPKKGGSMRPSDLGLEIRTLARKGSKFIKSEGPALKGCVQRGWACLSTTNDSSDPKMVTKLEPWRTPEGKSPPEEFGQLIQILRDYVPGTNGIDARGFRFLSLKPNYIYIQYQSAEGLIDDVEFALQGDGTVLVRASGRQYNDPITNIREENDNGSNAKRLNYISEKLRSAGWTAPEVTRETHAYYFKKNAL